MKLSINQAKIIKQMQEGWQLSLFGCFAGAVSNRWVNLGRIIQKNYPNGYDKEEHVSRATIEALLNKKLIVETEESKKTLGYSELHYYELTEQGKQTNLQSKEGAEK